MKGKYPVFQPKNKTTMGPGFAALRLMGFSFDSESIWAYFCNLAGGIKGFVGVLALGFISAVITKAECNLSLGRNVLSWGLGWQCEANSILLYRRPLTPVWQTPICAHTHTFTHKRKSINFPVSNTSQLIRKTANYLPPRLSFLPIDKGSLVLPYRKLVGAFSWMT